MSIKELFTPKRAKMSDIVSPTPSRAASRLLDRVMKRANDSQQAISDKAASSRSR